MPVKLRLCLIAVMMSVMTSAALADDWPQWLGPKRDGVWRESGILDHFPPGGPKILWRTPIGGGYAGPAVANGRVFVMDRQLHRGARNPANPFARRPVRGSERALCLDAETGRVIWKHEYPCEYRISYPAGPRTTPVIDGNRVYTLGAMGHLFCLDATDGRVVWSKSFQEDYNRTPPVWGWSSHPLIDGNKLICLVGGRGTTVVAFDKNTGRELWRALTSVREHAPGYCPPMIYDFGGVRQLIVWYPEAIASLDPETGEEYWRQPFLLRSGLSIPTPRKAGDLLFVTSFYNGPMLLRVASSDAPKASIVWRGKSNSERRTDKLHAIICTPVIKEGHIYGVCSYGQLRCLRLDTGERLWETFQATGGRRARWANAFLIPHRDRFFLFNEKGDLIIARLTPKGYHEIDRVHLLEPTGIAMGRDVLWSHPAFANRCMYARNDKEIICVSLAAESE